MSTSNCVCSCHIHVAASQYTQTGTFTYGNGLDFTVNYFPSLNLCLILQVRYCIDVFEIRLADKFILSFKVIFKWMFIIHYFYNYKKTFLNQRLKKENHRPFCGFCTLNACIV